MALAVGSQLGHYQVTALIGEGGMGQVYQATDTKLNRQVALKVLPDAVATDSDGDRSGERMMAASVTTESSLRVGTPRQLLQGTCYNLAPGATIGFLIICSLLALLSLSTPLDAIERAQAPETREAQSMAAEQGDADAQHRLGLAYQNGDGVSQDDVEAVRWYRRAAVQGHRRAQNDLGNAYATGAGVPQDTTEAIRWFRLAAEQGYAVAQGNLGVAYTRGVGVAEDATEAVRWFHLAADQGHPLAQYNLGLAYANGAGVPLDATEAVRWFRLAADQGDARAQQNLAVGYANGLGVSLDVTEAVRWFRLAADQGHAVAQYNLGIAYANGMGTPLDVTEAARWYRLAAEHGYGRAGDDLIALEAIMTSEQIAESRRLAREWKPTSEP